MVDGLTGLQKTQAERRLAEVEKLAQARSGRRRVNLIPLLDLKQDVMRGGSNWSVEQNALRISDGNFWPTVQFPYEPPEEYDYIITYTQPRNVFGIAMTIPAGGGKHCCWTFGWGDRCSFHGQPLVHIPNVIRAGATQTMTLEVRRGGLRALLDGVQVAQFTGNWKEQLVQDKDRAKPKLPTAIEIGVGDPTTFSRIEVIEISGSGKKLRGM